MNCQHAQPRLNELLDPRNATPATDEVRAHLSTCPDCQREFSSLQRTLLDLDSLPMEKPSPQLRANFQAMLEDEKQATATSTVARSSPRRRLNPWPWIVSPLAACGFLALGFIAGQRNTSVPNPEIETTRQQLAALQQKVDSMGQLVGYSLMKQQSASERLQRLLAAQHLGVASDQVLTQLISALALDPSTNVRLTALETLYPHADKDVVRAGVLASLSREQNPLVQVAMIDFLVAAQDREAIATFERLSQQETTNRSVRDSARRALAQL